VASRDDAIYKPIYSLVGSTLEGAELTWQVVSVGLTVSEFEIPSPLKWSLPSPDTILYFFGFVPPIPQPVDLTEKDCRLFAAIVNLDGLNEGFRDSTMMQYCNQFVKGLERGGALPNEIFDLAIGNPKYLSEANISTLAFNDQCFVGFGGYELDRPFLRRLEAQMSELELCQMRYKLPRPGSRWRIRLR